MEGIEPLSNQSPAAVPPREERGNVSDRGEESDFDGIEIGNEEVEELGDGAEDRGKQGNRGNPATRQPMVTIRTESSEGRRGAREKVEEGSKAKPF